ncbi:C6 transcription factor [Penicillium capsulatum]|nr:C6 transcription factor [Penicillium capsulatum]
MPEEVDYPTTYSAIVHLTPLAKIADGIYREFLLAKTAGTRIEYRHAESMERDLIQWRKGLPHYLHSADVPAWFQGARSVARWKEQNIRILLWRGTQKYHSYLPTKMNSEERCLDAAMETIHDIAGFCTMYDGALYQGITWYATYFLLQATLVLMARFLDNTVVSSEEEASAWHHSVFKARNCLRVVAARNKPATRYLDMLDRVCSQFQSPTLEQNLYSLSSLQEDLLAPSVNDLPHNTEDFLGLPSENDFALLGDSQFALNDEAADPNFRILINQVSHDFMGSMPLDLLFNDWINYS